MTTLLLSLTLLAGGQGPAAAKPDLTAGHAALSFTATDVSGKTVNFPADFKGKVVMLDFWATWCGPCMREVSNIVNVYNEEHANGFEILGVSLDNEKTIKNLDRVTKDMGMTWDQVADGKFWKADVAQQYAIHSIPHAFIIDGTTGMIAAEGNSIRAEKLKGAVEKALAAAHGAQSK